MMTALQELLAKVDAGGARYLLHFQPLSVPLQGFHGRAFEAYNGSLDAAQALHDAVLPGNVLWVTLVGGIATIGHDGEEYTGVSSSPARAWLIAIIKALIAQETTK